MGYLKNYWKKYKGLFFLAIICVSLEAACDLLQPTLMSDLIDNGAVKGDMKYVIHMGLKMLGVTGLGAIFAMTRNISASVASQGFAADIRYDMFAKIQSFSVADMDRFEGGSLVTRSTNDITQLQNFINGMMRIFFKAPIIFVGAIIMAARLNDRTIPVIIPIVVLVSAVIALSMHLTYPRFAQVQTALDKLNTTMREYLAGIRLVKAFRRFKMEENRFRKVNDLLTDETVRANRILVILSPAMNLFVNIGIAAIIYLGAGWVNKGEMAVGQIMAFVSYMSQILFSLGMITNVLNMFVRVKTSNERIRAVLEVPVPEQAVPDMPAAHMIPAEDGEGSDGHIVFKGVGFAYPGASGQAALSGLDFIVKRGETVGVIGSTGSGKSTLASLLMHFYHASCGQIRICGRPIDQIPEAVLRAHAAIVPQKASLFTGTIKENILWGKESATDAEVQEAASSAAAHEFVKEMPKGYDTMIGQSGVNLSGGQKQRISIARALIRCPEILILDDCTSALDVLTESRVKKAIRQFSNQITCILITQRVSTVMTCDKILVLDSGWQAGYGTHSELMDSCSIYRDIYLSQVGEEAM